MKKGLKTSSLIICGLTVLGLGCQSFAMDTSYSPVSITKSFLEIKNEDVKNKPMLMEKHKKILEERYNLSETVDAKVTMSGGKTFTCRTYGQIKKWYIMGESL